MKTMLNLLTRLLELRRCCDRAGANPQLSDGEKAAARLHKRLVRECLPPPVIATYDRMKRTRRDLLECPEVFAMAVLVSTYRHASPAQRKALRAHFPDSPPAAKCRQELKRQAKLSRRVRNRRVSATSTAGS